MIDFILFFADFKRFKVGLWNGSVDKESVMQT